MNWIINNWVAIAVIWVISSVIAIWFYDRFKTQLPDLKDPQNNVRSGGEMDVTDGETD